MSVWERITHHGRVVRDTDRDVTDWGIIQALNNPTALTDRAYDYTEDPEPYAAGGWVAAEQSDAATENEAVTHAMRWAINEAVHETLEWLQVDGVPVLSPHILEVESTILGLCDRLADDLIRLANDFNRSQE